MDDHANRVTQPLRDAWQDFQRGQASLLDLSRTAGQAAAALDHSNADLLRLLKAADSDLEYAYSATEREDHPEQARRIMVPILAALDASSACRRPGRSQRSRSPAAPAPPAG